MTREEDIRYFEMKKKEIQMGGSTVCGYNGYDAMCSAVDALREQEERSKGCEYCRDSKSIYEIKSPLHDSYNTDVYISEDALIVDIGCHSYGASKIKFCPMCGRRLEEV